jgi:hypothetical protein
MDHRIYCFAIACCILAALIISDRTERRYVASLVRGLIGR